MRGYVVSIRDRYTYQKHISDPFSTLPIALAFILSLKIFDKDDWYEIECPDGEIITDQMLHKTWPKVKPITSYGTAIK